MSYEDDFHLRVIGLALDNTEPSAAALSHDTGRELVQSAIRRLREELRIYEKRAKNAAVLIPTLAIALIGFVGIASADEPKAPQNASQCACATDGAREGEALADRIARLEMQLRLAKAEARVRRKAK